MKAQAVLQGKRSNISQWHVDCFHIHSYRQQLICLIPYIWFLIRILDFGKCNPYGTAKGGERFAKDLRKGGSWELLFSTTFIYHDVHWSGSLFWGAEQGLEQFLFVATLPQECNFTTNTALTGGVVTATNLAAIARYWESRSRSRCRSCRPSCPIQWTVYRSWLQALRKGEKEESCSWCYFWSRKNQQRSRTSNHQT